jgi:hypothetical protein
VGVKVRQDDIFSQLRTQLHRRGAQLHIALLGRPVSPRLLSDGANLSGFERPTASLRAAQVRLRWLRVACAYVLRKGAIRSHPNWDFQMRLPCKIAFIGCKNRRKPLFLRKGRDGLE